VISLITPEHVRRFFAMLGPVEHGADISAVDNVGSTPLHM
jgi:hypothetical protein